ncbi:MAG: hypothetical protein Q7T76_22050 [Ferruginibacter sp.]|nr:hypothetical protein [Ferruginibacter sp.]
MTKSLNTFEEIQGFRIWWAWIAVIALNILIAVAIIQQVVMNVPFGPEPAADWVLCLAGFLLLSLLFFLYSIKLKTSIDDNGIEYRFHPFQRTATVIDWGELSDAYIRTYNSFYEYGGYGIRIGSPKTGRAVNTSASSNEGLQLEFKNGELLLIGTKDPRTLELVIQYHKSKIRWGR